MPHSTRDIGVLWKRHKSKVFLIIILLLIFYVGSYNDWNPQLAWYRIKRFVGYTSSSVIGKDKIHPIIIPPLTKKGHKYIDPAVKFLEKKIKSLENNIVQLTSDRDSALKRAAAPCTIDTLNHPRDSVKAKTSKRKNKGCCHLHRADVYYQ